MSGGCGGNRARRRGGQRAVATRSCRRMSAATIGLRPSNARPARGLWLVTLTRREHMSGKEPQELVGAGECGEVSGFGDGYVVVAGGLLLLGGRIADMFGRRRVFLLGIGRSHPSAGGMTMKGALLASDDDVCHR